MVNSATPGMAWVDIAASAYRAYAASTGNKNFRGDPMPVWDQLPQPIRTACIAWVEAAVRQVERCLTDGFEAPDESERAGWVPPHLQQTEESV